MRGGESPQQVSAQTGWPIDRVERYAEQPLAERAFIADQALSVEIRRSGAVVSVRDTAVEVLARAGVDLGALVVDSARRADGKWAVHAEVPGAGISASWVYDHAARSLQPADEGARRLMGVEPVEPETPPAVDDLPVATAEPRPRLMAVPDAVADEAVAASAEGDEDVARADAEANFEPTPTADVNQETLALPVPTQVPPAPERPNAAPKAKPRAKGRRASVPSWDEILFGTSTHDGD